MILRETGPAVTPFEGVAVFAAYLHKIAFVEKVRQCMPICGRPPIQIEPAVSFTAFLMAVLVGARCFAHANGLRGDRALHALFRIDRFPSDDTIRNLFRRFTMGNVQRCSNPWRNGRWNECRAAVRATRLKQFFATEAAFRAILLLLNLLAEFQRAADLPRYSEPATIRTQVLTCGAILGRAGKRQVLHLSQSWGGLQTRNPLLDSIFARQSTTSPKFDSAPAT